jgi:hypothetical protein
MGTSPNAKACDRSLSFYISPRWHGHDSTIPRFTAEYPSPAMSFPRKRIYKTHHEGFFSSRPADWNVKDFVQYMFRNSKKDSSAASMERSILGSWTSHLHKISNCKNNKCCNKHRRKRAEMLYQAYARTVRFDLSFCSSGWQTPGSFMLHKADFLWFALGRA